MTSTPPAPARPSNNADGANTVSDAAAASPSPAAGSGPAPDQAGGRVGSPPARAAAPDAARPVPAPGQAGGGGRRPIRRALVSVYDKTGLDGLARALGAAGVEIVSTGSTAQAIAAAGVRVTPVERLTGFPECLDGRVKTLHPKVHAGILADLRLPAHSRQLEELGIEPFDLVVVNLYPFAATVASGAAADECVEQIDIGGPAMVRAAAKNHPSVAIVTSPERYPEVVAALAGGGFSLARRRELARDAFIHTADYDVAVATWMSAELAPAEGLPAWRGATFKRLDTLRYGENPHQAAAVYAQVSGGGAEAGAAGEGGGLAQAELLSGKAMSFNNYGDADAARRAVLDFDQPAVAIVKHANPCGIAIGADIAEAHRLAHACDPLSAFGGVIAANRTVTLAMAEQVKPIFTEVIVAPGYEPAALELLSAKKTLRILRLALNPLPGLESKPVSGGLLVQERDAFQAAGDDPANWRLVAGPAADPATWADLAFAWKACRAVKSNAILLARGGASVGVGMGQVNRVDAAELAVKRAGAGRAQGAAAASDAFFPFPDGLEVLIGAGVKAVVEPGGSIRDQAVIEAAEAAGVSLYFTGSRHFFH
ncbi:MAG: bifunctional phosphoribosylaminoimidazolecarboxamide formyltransferase/IMP cyclohydrolase [Bifidobacteriaceae bacterium]|jgi:phosphoribosylaminoimidazolecarboxamide formyltransferase/IMP cyclohydrolase|nr:bifunctional phosphoribosylaminoimidazolecarboxamide formyltransferase/IMP cyclohydrolase [Bifidobacteriaceae bacterium]